MGKDFEIIRKIEALLPKNALIVDTLFEGANVVLYSKNKDFVLTGSTLIKKIVNTLKKRVEVRADNTILMPVEAAEKFAKDTIPADAELDEILFDEKRSLMIIEALKPGAVIGKGGEIIRKIYKKTLWTPIIRRSPAIKSDLIKTIRYNLYKNSDYRRKFLNDIGEKIYAGFEKNKNYWIRTSFLGAAREVGRSCILLQTPNSRVLLDSGINVASEDNMFPRLDVPEMDITSLDAIVVSHAHMDHVGFIPYLFKYGFRGAVYVTEPTRDLMTLTLIDAINVSQKEGKDAPYSIGDVKEMIKHMVALDYGTVTDITSDVRLTFLNAGHVIGSSMIHLNIGDGYHNLLYTGDLKTSGTNLLPSVSNKFSRVETVIMESTYGGAISPPIEESKKKFIDLINSALKTDNKVLLPVLSTGRAQEIIVILEEALTSGSLPKDVPIYIDGMVWDINAIHTTYPEFFNRKIGNKIFNLKENPFLHESFKQVGSQKEREQILAKKSGAILLATSGMLVGGPSVFYLENLADDPKNLMILTCYQPPGGLGRSIQEGLRELVVKQGRRTLTVPIKLRVDDVKGFSGHSDKAELVRFITTMKPKPRRVIIVHGEKSNCLEVASSIFQKSRIETTVPRLMDSIRIR